MRAGTAAVTTVFGLAACAATDGDPAPVAPSVSQGTVGASEPSASVPPETRKASATVPVKGGKIAADFGMSIGKGVTFFPLIVRGTTVPATHSEDFTTAEDNQPTIKIDVFFGLTDRIADAQRVGRYEVTVPKPAAKRVPQLSVTFAIDGSGAVQLTATDSISGAPATVSAVD